MNPTIRPQSNADGVPTADSSSFGKQLTGVIVAAILVLLLSRLGGLLVAITGIFAFLDAWSAGIRKDASKKSFLNISPMAWGIAVMWLFVISYPIYALTRNRLRTTNGTTGYWVATNVFGVIMLAMFAIQVAAYLGQQPS